MKVMSNITNDHKKIVELVDNFDLDNEPHLLFKDNLKQNLDLIRKETLDKYKFSQKETSNKNHQELWDYIKCTTRRIIICDREMDFKNGISLIAESEIFFKDLEVEENSYEWVRYKNSCGLINYRCGNYQQGLENFKLAYDVANRRDDLEAFLPDFISNVIRTEFELYYQVLPDVIKPEYILKCKIDVDKFIERYIAAIEKYKKFNTVSNKKRAFYGHGMASLYHNLAETYASTIKKDPKDKNEEKFSAQYSDPLILAKIANEKSLEYGMEYGDIYRQLQSKRALSDVYEKIAANYNDKIEEGQWRRGKIISAQKNIRKSKDKETLEKIINKPYFSLDEITEDKMGILYNYDAIKDFIKNNENIYGKEIEISLENENKLKLSLLNIADAKLEVAEKLRNVYSSLLYRRQVIQTIRDDIFYKTTYLLKEAENEKCQEQKEDKYGDALNFIENYTCRSTFEMEKIFNSSEFNYDVQKERIEKVKTEILKEINKEEELKDQTLKKYNCKTNDNLSLSSSLSIDTNVKFLDLIMEFEEILKSPQELESTKTDYKYIDELNQKLRQLPDHQNTLILKFLMFQTTVWAFFITKKGIRCKKIESKVEKTSNKHNSNLINNIIKEVKNFDLKSQSNVSDKLFKYMDELNKILGLTIILKEEQINNIFIIPDGELFQVPLHLINEEGEDLRIKYNVYYSPSLNYVLRTKSVNNLSKAKYLWITSPSNQYQNLCKGNKPILDIPIKFTEDNTILKCKEATQRNLEERLSKQKYTHVCFSSHCYFSDDIVTSYASHILLNNSFITPYDFLLMNTEYLDSISTVFIGACSGGSSKYTDDNEVVGMVTALLSKNVQSIIAPLWKIFVRNHNSFVKIIEKNVDLLSPKPWNLSSIIQITEDNERMNIIPFVQFAALDIIPGED